MESGVLGDWALTFTPSPVRLLCRRADMPWESTLKGADWHLWTARPGEDWRGFPYLRITTPEWQAWLIGEWYGRSRSAESFQSMLNGETGLASLNGHFHLLAHAEQADEWHFWTNRFATLHAYRGDNGHRTALGSFMPAVAAATGCDELDWVGLTSFFGFGFFADDLTHYSGVRAFRPATHYRFDGRGRTVTENRYWSWSHVPDDSRSYDDTVDAFAEIFDQVMTELMADGRMAIPISGGLDSRSTVATIATHSSLSSRVWAYSYGYGDDSIETKIAGRIAAARDLPFQAFTIGPYLFDQLELISRSIEGFQDVTQARQAAIGRPLRDNTDRVIAAHWGDVFLDDMGLVEAPSGSMSTAELAAYAQAKFSKPAGWLLENVCRAQLKGAAPEAVLSELIRNRIAPLDSIAEPDFRIKAFKTEQWSARWTTASLRMFQAASFPRLPFYDTRIADFFATVPTSYVAGRRLQIDYLKRYAPDLAAIPWQVTGTDLYKAAQPTVSTLPRRALNKGIRFLTGRKVIERNWEVQFLNQTGREALAHWLLRPGLRLHEFVPQASVASFLEAFHADPLADKRGYTVSMLLTFSSWLELQGTTVKIE